MDQNLYSGLTTNVLFSGLSMQDMEAVLEKASFYGMAENGFFFHQGDEASGVFVLSAGRVKLNQLSADGQQVLMRMVGKWELFGVIAIVHESQFPVAAQAVEASQAYYWKRQDMMELVGRFPQLSINALKVMAEYLQDFQSRFRELATERVERRLARTLIRLASQMGKKTAEGVLIDMPLTRQDLAEMTGTTQYSVSRILSAWEADGLVICGREKVIIHYPHGLVSIAEDL